jgi:glutathione S-transferase
MVVPTLIDGDVNLFQSLAILEYLDEAYPEPPLLPADPVARAWVRGSAMTKDLPGLQAIETLLAEHPASGQFCHGDGPTIADICVVTQVTPAMTFNLPRAAYPQVMRVYNTCMAIPAFADAHPSKQPDAEWEA